MNNEKEKAFNNWEAMEARTMEPMKIRRLQITMEPHAFLDESRRVVVEVHTECGRIFSTMDYIDRNHFQDVFGCLMKDAEHRIRKLFQEKNTPADK